MLFIVYGKIVSYFIKEENRIFNFLYGFVTIIGINQILLTPCILLHVSFNVALYITIIVDVLLVIISFFLKSVSYKKTENKVLTIIVSMCIGLQLILVFIFTKYNPDDSFYVSLSTSNIGSNAIYMEEPSMGYLEENSMLTVTEQIPSIELQIAIMSYVSNINPAIMCHTILPIIIVFIAYLAFYYFARVFMDDKKAKIFLIILSVILLFTGFSTKFRAGCLFIKPWQGKAIFLNIGMPMILSYLIRIQEKIKKKDIILLAVVNLFSIALTSTAIFLISFIYLSFGILKLIKLKWKDILWLLISFIPIIIYTLILVYMNHITGGGLDVPKNDVSIWQSLQFYNNSTYLIYYIISTIVILLIGTVPAKKYFVLIQFINLLTIWNPYFSNIIAKYFTSSATFWRVLWILPIEFSIAYAVVLLLDKIKRNIIKIIAFIVVLLLLIIPGEFIYKDGLIENLENIPQYIVNQTNYILEQGKDDDEIVLLGTPEFLHYTTMRHMTSKIKLIYSRELYIDKIKNNEEIKERTNLNKMYSGEYVYTIEELNEIIQKQKIDWMIIDLKSVELMEYINKSCLTKKCEIDGFALYYNN